MSLPRFVDADGIEWQCSNRYLVKRIVPTDWP